MPVSGPKPSDSTHYKQRLAHDWIEVVDRPYDGPIPFSLPATRIIKTSEGPERVPLLPETRRWWATVSTMPHCTLWAESDWLFAWSTALVADLAFRGVTSATSELRQRENVLGTTIDSGRSLRIRYVSEDAPVVPMVGNVVDMGRRARVIRVTDG